jgi:hypothetical protein
MDLMTVTNLFLRAISKIGELIMHLRYESSFNQKTEYISPRDDTDFGINSRNSYNISSKLSKCYTDSSTGNLIMNINFYLEKKSDRECCLVERWVISGNTSDFLSSPYCDSEQFVNTHIGGFLRSIAVLSVSLPLWHEYIQRKGEKTNLKGEEFFLDHEISFGKTETKKQQNDAAKGGYDVYKLPFLPNKPGGLGLLNAEVEYLSNLDLVNENLSSASNITFVLSEDGRTENSGKINLRANMRDRFFSDDISEGPVIQKK